MASPQHVDTLKCFLLRDAAVTSHSGDNIMTILLGLCICPEGKQAHLRHLSFCFQLPIQPARQEPLQERKSLSSNCLLAAIVNGILLVIATFEHTFLFLPIIYQVNGHCVNRWCDVCVFTKLL